jgi:hypothetical protein
LFSKSDAIEGERMEQSSATLNSHNLQDKDQEKLPGQSILQIHGLNIGAFLVPLLVAAFLALFPALVSPQAVPFAPGTATIPDAPSPQPALDYVRPTQRTKIRNYVFDAYGPLPIAGAAVAAGINQLSNAPPEWNQGAAGFGKRFGSDFAIATVATTARYGLAQALKEDTLYYRCECHGFMPRLGHSVFSTFIARRGEDGHHVFSIPALVAPYAGSITAVYGWYPNRFGAKDALRIGNYSLLAYVGGNVGLEFIYGGPHSLLSHVHLNNVHIPAAQSPSQ